MGQGGLRGRDGRWSRRAFLQGAALGGAAALGAACSAPAPAAAAPLPVEFGIISPTASYWTVFVMERQGLLQREGIEPRLTITRTPASGLQALVAGDGLAIMGSSTDPAIRAVEQGSDFVFVGGIMLNPAYTLVSQPDITSLADLRGKNVAVNGVRDAPITLIRRLLVGQGLGADSVDFVPVGGTPERYAALKGGAVAATVLSQPNDFQAEAEGFRALASLAASAREYQFTAWTVRQSWARANADTLVRFLRAHAAACRWLTDSANEEAAVALLADATRSDEALARRTYALYLQDLRGQVIPADGSLSLPGLQAVLGVMADLGEFDGPPPAADKYVDGSYQQRALQG